ncbi:MAG TPA: hypothetical protein VF678_16435 [bacterium]
MNAISLKQWSLVAAAALLLALSGCNPSSSSNTGGDGGGGATSEGSVETPVSLGAGDNAGSVAGGSSSYYTRNVGNGNAALVVVTDLSAPLTVNIFSDSSFIDGVGTRESTGTDDITDFSSDTGLETGNAYVRVDTDNSGGATFKIAVSQSQN